MISIDACFFFSRGSPLTVLSHTYAWDLVVRHAFVKSIMA